VQLVMLTSFFAVELDAEQPVKPAMQAITPANMTNSLMCFSEKVTAAAAQNAMMPDRTTSRDASGSPTMPSVGLPLRRVADLGARPQRGQTRRARQFDGLASWLGVILPGLLIDRLPRRLWRPGNLYLGMRLHFCIADDEDGKTVRTVEWQGSEIGRGRRERTLPI
jgi:hypothetical protein